MIKVDILKRIPEGAGRANPRMLVQKKALLILAISWYIIILIISTI
jgi:hypothetical protein